MIVLDLPWPSKALHPNARPHWAQRASAAKKAREWAQWASCSYGPIDADKLDVTIIFNPPDKRRRDLDGMLSSVKNFCDGIADSLEVDDSKWSLALRRGDPIQGGNVRFEIEVPA